MLTIRNDPDCVPVEQDPEPAPDMPVFPPLGADGDRDAAIDWQAEMRRYHSHLCPCPACPEAEQRRQSQMKDWLKIASQW